jgi:hypothetical protein
MIAGLAHYLTLVVLGGATMRTYGYLPWWQCVSLLVLLAAYLALYPGFLHWHGDPPLPKTRTIGFSHRFSGWRWSISAAFCSRDFPGDRWIFPV